VSERADERASGDSSSLLERFRLSARFDRWPDREQTNYRIIASPRSSFRVPLSPRETFTRSDLDPMNALVSLVARRALIYLAASSFPIFWKIPPEIPTIRSPRCRERGEKEREKKNGKRTAARKPRPDLPPQQGRNLARQRLLVESASRRRSKRDSREIARREEERLSRGTFLRDVSLFKLRARCENGPHVDRASAAGGQQLLRAGLAWRSGRVFISDCRGLFFYINHLSIDVAHNRRPATAG